MFKEDQRNGFTYSRWSNQFRSSILAFESLKMIEVARQSSTMVSTGRRRLKIIIVVLAVILVALLLGAFVYLLYNNVSRFCNFKCIFAFQILTLVKKKY